VATQHYHSPSASFGKSRCRKSADLFIDYRKAVMTLIDPPDGMACRRIAQQRLMACV